MLAERPASPPPTTMILGIFVAAMFLKPDDRTGVCAYLGPPGAPDSNAGGDGGSFSGVLRHCGLKNAATVANPTAMNTTATRVLNASIPLRERSLTVMPHLEQNR